MLRVWGRSGRSHCRKFSEDFREISANFPQNFRTLPKGPSRTVFTAESDSVVFCYSVVNLLCIVIHYSSFCESVLAIPLLKWVALDPFGHNIFSI